MNKNTIKNLIILTQFLLLYWVTNMLIKTGQAMGYYADKAKYFEERQR